MFLAILIVHVLVSILLVLIVLIQTGRGAELGAAFGGMGQATYGRTQGTFLTKFTTALAVVFMTTSLSLAFISSEQPTRSIITAPAAPAAPAGQAEPTPPQTEQAAPPAPEQQPAAAQDEPAPSEKPLEQTKAPPKAKTQ